MTKKQEEKFQSEAASYLYNKLKNDEQAQAEIEKNCAGKDERRTHTLNIRFNDFEWERLENSVKEKGYKSKADYIRACINARMTICMDKSDLIEVTNCVRTVSSNINQIALRVNQTHRIFSEDIEQLKRGVNEIWQSLVSIQSKVQSVEHCNTSLMELKPETVTLWTLLLARQSRKKQENSSGKSQQAEQEEIQSLPIT